MTSENHVHIVPAVPPAFNGFFDYCYKLWQHWPQPRPAWCALAPNVPPHELWTRGSPCQSTLWLQPLTKNIVVQLAHLADSWMTSSEVADWKLIGQARADVGCGHIVPIGSAIETQTPVDWEWHCPLNSGGQLRLAIFALPSNRILALRAHRRLLELLIAGNCVESVRMIGKSGDANTSHLERELREQISPTALWHEYHDLAPADISPVLAGCHEALSHYSPDLR